MPPVPGAEILLGACVDGADHGVEQADARRVVDLPVDHSVGVNAVEEPQDVRLVG